MKTIEPVKVWSNGQEVDATILNASAYNDNLFDSATFEYQLCVPVPVEDPRPNPQVLISSLIKMSGDAYENWDTNDYAYDWIAQQLNLTITGEYVPPVPPSPEPPAPVPPVTVTPE